MEVILASLALAFALVSGGVSILLYLHREDIHGIASKIRNLELETADLVDRLSVWQRRDASRQRKVGGDAPAEFGGLQPDQHQLVSNSRGQLREIARARGLVK